MCLNRKVLVGLAVAALAVLTIAPGAFSRVLPLLVVAACPLSMMLMMGAMSGGKKTCATDRSEPEAARDEEMTRLRAELDQLRAGQPGGREHPQGAPRA